MIKQAVQFITSGKVVVFPTETVYGIGADATNQEACLKIFQFKNRPAINPLIVHVSSIEQAKEIGEFNYIAGKIAEKFWSGPLSIVVPLKENANIATAVTAGLKTIAIRIPSHPLALELIKQSGKSIAAPSANPSNYISPTRLDHVTKHFNDNEEIFILTDKHYQSKYGLESTIVDTTTDILTILREGFITAEVLEAALDIKIGKASKNINIKAPGMLEKHYSPIVPIRLNATNLNDKEIGLNFDDSNLKGEYSLNLSSKGDLTEAAANLYAYLRLLDDYAAAHNIEYIAVAPIPSINIGVAINDRLKRAANN
ncbi:MULTISPECIES: L-threonylcarbamoyladenylate synthase [unclassified Rickettsia]|uniref:L-threonylcarbamoyladenylate synthase n=1 Tax=unclassified Rickettsia TaxID=114295 RepID=UPI0031333E7F